MSRVTQYGGGGAAGSSVVHATNAVTLHTNRILGMTPKVITDKDLEIGHTTLHLNKIGGTVPKVDTGNIVLRGYRLQRQTQTKLRVAAHKSDVNESLISGQSNVVYKPRDIFRDTNKHIK